MGLENPNAHGGCRRQSHHETKDAPTPPGRAEVILCRSIVQTMTQDLPSKQCLGPSYGHITCHVWWKPEAFAHAPMSELTPRMKSKAPPIDEDEKLYVGAGLTAPGTAGLAWLAGANGRCSITSSTEAAGDGGADGSPAQGINAA